MPARRPPIGFFDAENAPARQQELEAWRRSAAEGFLGPNLSQGDYSPMRGILGLTQDYNAALTGDRPMTTLKGEELNRPWQILRLLTLMETGGGGAPVGAAGSGVARGLGRGLKKELDNVIAAARKAGNTRRANELQRVVDNVGGLREVLPHLTPDERAGLTQKAARSMVETFRALPAADEMASIAYAGRAKKGWYLRSGQGLHDVFGEDTPRFTALLASLSPQTSVEENLKNALKMWMAWDRAGRPTHADAIKGIMAQSVSKKSADNMTAWLNNATRSLSADDPARLVLSGPKVNSFMLDLRGVAEEVTNDAWMATYHGYGKSSEWSLDPLRHGAKNPRDFFDRTSAGGKGPRYLAGSAKAREAAKILTRRTGENWTPMEVQEAVWSWAKAATEKRGPQSVEDFVTSGGLTHGQIGEVPDFGQLLSDDIYNKILAQGGYDVGRPGRSGGGLLDVLGRESPSSAPQGAGIAPSRFERHLRDAARRLDERLGTSGRESKRKLLDSAWSGAPDVDHGGLPRSFERGSLGDLADELVFAPDDIAAVHRQTPFAQKQFSKAGSSTSPVVELRPGVSTVKAFRSAIQKSKKESPYGAAVHIYEPEEYAGMRMFMTPDGTAGFALKGDDIVSVFNQKGSPHSGFTDSAIQLGIQQGGRRLDAFETVLPALYGNNRLRAVGRQPWNEAYKPKGWSKQRFKRWNKGEPDIVGMTYDPKARGIYQTNEGAYVPDLEAAQRKALGALPPASYLPSTGGLPVPSGPTPAAAPPLGFFDAEERDRGIMGGGFF